MTRGVPFPFIAFGKKRLAAATSRFAVSRKSTVRPCLSTARYRYVHRPFTFIYVSSLYICLVAAPRSAHQPGVPAPPLLEFRDVPLNPAQNGRVREFDPALAHHIHQIARTQFVTEIPPDTQDDDLLVEMSTFK